MEGARLGLFMMAACGFATLLEHPASPVHQALHDGDVRRLLMGVAMGLTAIGLIYSPWGQQSGAHMNPSLTLTYFRLGKIARGDALGMLAGHPAVRFAATAPGPAGATTAFVAELMISFLLMSVVLTASNSPRLARHTPRCRPRSWTCPAGQRAECHAPAHGVAAEVTIRGGLAHEG